MKNVLYALKKGCLEVVRISALASFIVSSVFAFSASISIFLSVTFDTDPFLLPNFLLRLLPYSVVEILKTIFFVQLVFWILGAVFYLVRKLIRKGFAFLKKG